MEHKQVDRGGRHKNGLIACNVELRQYFTCMTECRCINTKYSWTYWSLGVRQWTVFAWARRCVDEISPPRWNSCCWSNASIVASTQPRWSCTAALAACAVTTHLHNINSENTPWRHHKVLVADTPWFHCCHVSTATRHSDGQGWASECPDVKNYKVTA